MKIAFFLRTGSINRGSEAIIRGFSELLSNANHDVEITLYSANPQEDKRANIPLVKENEIRKREFKRYSFLWLIRGIFSRLNITLKCLEKYSYRHIFNQESNFDLIIIVGADNYDVAYRMFENMHTLNIMFRRETKGKMLLYDCSVDEAYFEDNKLKQKLQADWDLFDAVTVREMETWENCKEHITHKNIQYFPDPAFVMPVIKTDLPEGWKSGKMVGINLSNLIAREHYGAGAEKIKNAYYYLIENIIEKTDNDIVFIPHVMQGKDLGILTELYEKYKDTNRAILIDNEKLFAPELKYIISQCQFLITARTHASIAAYSTCVPTLVLGYSVKAKGIAIDLFGKSEGYVLPVQQLNEKEELWNAFAEIMKQEDEIKKHLQKVIPAYQQKVYETGNLIKSLYDKTIQSFLRTNKKEYCCGCEACAQICPVSCIKMVIDDEGFWYPDVDKQSCTNCNLCLKVCPYNNKITDKNEKSIFYAAYNIDDDVLRNSSSGGIFWLLVQYTIAQKGVVYGVALENNFTVVHRRAETLNDCEKFRRSKYLQSKIADMFKETKLDLKTGRTVLFSGTPCQIAGLYTFLQRDYDNLFTCEVICHGVPSKMLFDKYIKEISINKKAVSIIWRNKRYGWRPNHVSVQFDDNSESISPSQTNPFQKGFLSNLYLRPSCYKCPFAHLPRIADVSLADFWGYYGKLDEKNNNRGLSLVITSSKKGNLIWEIIKGETLNELVTENCAINRNYNVWRHSPENKKRESIFKSKKTFHKVMQYYITPPFYIVFFRKIKLKIKTVLIYLKFYE
jgi:polysaccharide pyruvyl transferase WcaK-like protein/coenzyme F420-reducing hydrogenase beta subunit